MIRISGSHVVWCFFVDNEKLKSAYIILGAVQVRSCVHMRCVGNKHCAQRVDLLKRQWSNHESML